MNNKGIEQETCNTQLNAKTGSTLPSLRRKEFFEDS